MQSQFELSPEPLFKLGLGRLARYGTHQKTISGGRAEQKYLSSDPRLEWPTEGHYSSLHAFMSFKLPILTDKSLNITLLPGKSEIGPKGKQVKRTLLG